MSQNIKVAIGTNAWVSRLVFGGDPETILRLSEEHL